jgi:hypothetical protein
MRKPAICLALLTLLPAAALAQFADAERNALAEPFRGVTTDGTVQSGLFRIQSTGVSTAPVKAAAEAFLAGLSPAQQSSTMFPVNDDEWRKWANVHRYVRQGVGFADMDERQRGLAHALFQASLSAKGLKITRDIMRLNETLAELTRRPEEYGEYLYWITIMGKPSATEPWGWQLDGHHLVINYFVLGDQVVMTPTFMGSEPVIADSGKYQGTRILDDHRDRGLALVNALTDAQRKSAILGANKTSNRNQAELFRDNVVIPYAGVRGAALDARQKALLTQLISEYVGNMADGHARVKMSEVQRHLDDTWFAWIGGTAQDSAFYYRVHSPVILIELDHQTPVALPGERLPHRNHIHTVVRTPNGNDYGKDLLRQHLEQHRHDPEHGHDHPPAAGSPAR